MLFHDYLKIHSGRDGVLIREYRKWHLTNSYSNQPVDSKAYIPSRQGAPQAIETDLLDFTRYGPTQNLLQTLFVGVTGYAVLQGSRNIKYEAPKSKTKHFWSSEDFACSISVHFSLDIQSFKLLEYVITKK